VHGEHNVDHRAPPRRGDLPKAIWPVADLPDRFDRWCSPSVTAAAAFRKPTADHAYFPQHWHSTRRIRTRPVLSSSGRNSITNHARIAAVTVRAIPSSV
jgi:hypothetical protein